MDTDKRSVILIYRGKEVEQAVICDTPEDARQLLGNLFDTKRQFEAMHAETFDPEKHIKIVQQDMFAKEAANGHG